MSELGEGRIRNMNPYQSVRKAETGLDSDIIPWESRECTLAEIRNSVIEAGSHEALASGSSQQIITSDFLWSIDIIINFRTIY